jgi:hypothetical protein
VTLFSQVDSLPARREIARGSLAPLASSLAADVEGLLSRDIYFPSQKALLSREGGRCALDGTLLAFEPFQPHEHRCPVCGTVYRGELHDRFWIYWYQLWLAERAVHAALLHALGFGARFADLATAILDGYVARYDAYPNADNVLGPTRLFFSTYLESIWLLQVSVALDLIETHDPSLAGRVRDRIIEPSRAIIGEYDEGGSNRQVWNSVALLAAARVLGDASAAGDAVHGRSGIVSHLDHGLLSDGTWFEGENYHQFAHRGLWYGVTLAEAAGMELPPALVERFQRGFAAPFATALPDFTLPSRRDSQYAISLRQWRIAEHCELGLARVNDAEVLGALQHMYRDDIPRRDTGRRTSSADVERNSPPSALTRADLSWRALLCARAVLPELEASAPQSVLLEGQGIAVFRRAGARSYVALDYGHSGGGHGHPDRLNLLLADGNTRWFDDYGTGSYVDPTLHWYRSTLAHNAPLFDGKSQRRVNGSLVAYDEQVAAGWIVAAADEIADGVSAQRTVVVMDGYLVDVVTWRADHDTVVDLPMHTDVTLLVGVDALESAVLAGGAGLEDGFDFARTAERQRADANVTVRGARQNDEAALQLWARTSAPAEWWRAVAPGPPGAAARAFRVVRTHGHTGSLETVLAWNSGIIAAEFSDGVRVTMRDGAVHHHRQTDAGWTVERIGGDAHDIIALGGYIPVAAEPASPRVVIANVGGTGPTLVLPPPGQALTTVLGETHYRRSETPWTDAGRLEARVTLERAADGLRVSIGVPRSHRLFSAANAVNLYDNEHPDINGDGVQLYLHSEHGLSAWMFVPEPGAATVRSRPIDGWDAVYSPTMPRAAWQPWNDGYHMEIELPAPLPDAIDVIVNVTSPGRERREAQLVMSGALGEFVYLRGDRHEAARLIRLQSDE